MPVATHLHDETDTMNNQTTTLADFPAVRVIAPKQSIDEAFQLIAGHTVHVMIHGQWRAFTPNTVVSYALRYHEDPIAAHDSAVVRGHKTHWMSQDAVVLRMDAVALHMHDGTVTQEVVVGLELGQLVKLEGRTFRLVAAANNNVDLHRILVHAEEG